VWECWERSTVNGKSVVEQSRGCSHDSAHSTSDECALATLGKAGCLNGTVGITDLKKVFRRWLLKTIHVSKFLREMQPIAIHSIKNNINNAPRASAALTVLPL